MASSYTISLGDGRVDLGNVTGTYIAVQVIGDSFLDADITVKLQQTSDGVNYDDLTDTTKTILSGGGAVVIESNDFVLDNIFLYVTVGSATTGEVNIFTSLKKKEDSGDVSISGSIDANITNSDLDVTVLNSELDVTVLNAELDVNIINEKIEVVEDSNEESVMLFREMLEELQKINKMLKKIYK
jgi:hypothetical protein